MGCLSLSLSLFLCQEHNGGRNPAARETAGYNSEYQAILFGESSFYIGKRIEVLYWHGEYCHFIYFSLLCLVTLMRWEFLVCHLNKSASSQHYSLNTFVALMRWTTQPLTFFLTDFFPNLPATSSIFDHFLKMLYLQHINLKNSLFF